MRAGKKMWQWCAAACASLLMAGTSVAAPDFNISAYTYDNQPTPLSTNTTTTFRVTVGSVGDAPTTPVRVSIDVPAGVAVVPGSFPSYCVLKNPAPASPTTLGTQILQCELPAGAIGGVGTSEEIAYVGRAVVPSNTAYLVQACIDNTLAAVAAYPVSNANCQSYPGDGDTANDINGTVVLINAANDLGISFAPAAPDAVVSGAAYTFVANVTTNGLDAIPAGQVQAEFNVQPGFAPASSAAVTAASPGWTCTVVGSKIICILNAGVASNPSGNTVPLAPINIPGTVVFNGGSSGMDAIVSSNDNTAAVADPRPANNGPVVKTINISAGGNVKAEKSFLGQIGTATAAVTGTSTVRIGATLDTGGAPMPAGATVTDDFSVMIAKGFALGSPLPAACASSGNIVTCTTTAALNPGSSVFFDIPLTNPANLPTQATGINEAIVTPPTVGFTDSNPLDNTKALPYLVLPGYTDLEIIPVVGARKVVLGGTITRGVVVQNNGPLAVNYTAANPLRAYGNIAPQENGGGAPVCPPILTSPWETCAVSGTQLLFTTGAAVGTLPAGASTAPATFTSTAPLTATGTGPSTQVCTGQRLLDLSSPVIAPSGGAQPPERTGAGGTLGPANEYANDCKNSRGIEYINPAAAAGDLQITKTVATLTAGQACDATTAASGFASAQTLASVASNDNALCFRMEVKNENPNRADVAWGSGGPYVHGAAPDYVITDTLPMFWGINGNAGENLPSPQSFVLAPALNAGAGESCTLSGANINCALKSLPANGTRTLYVRIARGMFDGTFVNTATTDSKNLLEPDDVTGSTGFAGNTATATSIIDPVIDLQVAGKAINPNPIPVGKLGQYVFTYRNLGPNPSQQARVTDVIDTTRWEIVGTPVNTRGEICALDVDIPSAGRTTVRCDLNTTPFERGQEFQVIIQVRPKFPYLQPAPNSNDGFSDNFGAPGYINPGSGLPLNVPVASMPGYTNTAQITSTRAIEAERSLTNNANSVLVKVAPPRFDLITSKTDVGPGLNGDNLLFPAQVSYRITIVNSGESKTNGVYLVDLKPVTVSGNVPNFGATTAVANNGQTRTLSLVSAVREGVLSGRAVPATPCVDNTPLPGMIRCDIATAVDQQFLLPSESVSWLLTFDITPASPAIRGNIVLPNRARAASLEAPFDMTVAGTVDYDKDQVRNATENTTWFAPVDLEISAKQTITPSLVNLNQTAQFNITFHNNGPSPIKKVRIVENLPPGFTFVSASFVKQGASLPGTSVDYPVSCGGTNTVVCDIGDTNTAGDFVAGNVGNASGVLQVITKVTNWAAVQAAGFNPANLTNTAVIEPGLDPANDKPLGKDTVSTNNSGSSTISVLKTSLSGKVCQVTQGANQADAATKNCTGPSPIVGTSIKICGVDAFGSNIGGGTPAANADCASPITGVTNASGDWEILIPPGNYTIVESQPAGFSDYTEQAGSAGGTVATGPQTTATNSGLIFGSLPEENKISNVPVIAGSAATAAQRNPTGYNFTEIVNTGISGFVYEDLNNNGTKDIGEPGIQGASIRLTGTDFDGNVVNVTATTNSSGLYEFSVPPSSTAGYALTQTQPPGYYDGKEHTGNPAGTQVPGNVIANSEANNSAQGYSTIGGPVATGTSNTPTDIITTSVLIEAQGQSQHNFGEIRPGTIAGVVYIDSDGSVSKQTAETKTLPNVTVTLTGTDSLGNAVSATTFTNASGTYTFANLLPGEYNVQVANVPGYDHTGASVQGPNAMGATYAPLANNTPSIVPAVGAAAGGATTPAINTIKLGPGGVSQGNNFGERGSDISGRVCEDYNNDGICQAGEPGISGVTITLSGTDAGGNLITRTAVTSGTGLWVINDIPAPNATGYTLEEAQPAGFLDGRQSLGSLTTYVGGATTTPGSTTPTDVTTPAVRDRMTGIVFKNASRGVNYDFAEVRPASLQGFVYLDASQDGTRNPGTEPGIAGVTMELKGIDDMGQDVSLTTTLTTSPDGSYSFANLRPGTYEVREIQPTSPSVFDGTVTVGSVTTPTQTSVVGSVIIEAPSTSTGQGEGVQGIVLGSGGAGAGYNFGEVPRLSISGRVILDADASGTLTGAETGIPNVTTTIRLCADAACTTVLASTVTNAITGNYQFNDLPPGNYFVVEDQPIGYASSTANTIPVTLTTTSATNRNFFETGAQISGTVYSDNDASGALGSSDTGISSVSLRLCLTSQLATCTSTNAVATATTVVSGSYTFANVPAPPSGDSYVIVEDESLPPLSSITNGTATVGSLTGGTSPANGGIVAAEQGSAFTGNSTINGISFVMPTTPTTGTPVIGLGYNFGELPLSSISGAVILDRDFNGQNGGTDTGLPVTTTVTLCRTDTNPCDNTVTSTVTTPGSGTYSFAIVTPGNYFVIETQPPGYASSSPNSTAVSVVGSTPVNNVNFFETGARLSGTVYWDVNYSGVYNVGGPDSPLANVTVRLCTTASCTTVISTATTTAAGFYQFDDVPAPAPGQSYVIVEPSTVNTGTTTLGDGTASVGSFAVSGTGGGSNVGTANSPASRIEGVTWTPPTSVVTGAPAVVGTNFNFGEVEGFDVSGRVYLDRNRNGNSDEPAGNGINAVVITLCRTAGVPCTGSNIVATTTTATDGNYTFVKVPPGSYFMQESQPAGYGSTPTVSAPSVTDVRPFTVAGSALTGIDFADTLSSISGLVYLDTNGDQTLDPATETTRLPGITITLTGVDAAGVNISTVTFTSAAGTYTFGDLKTGTYTVTESQPPIYGIGGATRGSSGGTGGSNTNVISAISLPPGTDSINNNFGDVPRDGAISGSLWRDNDHDRIKDPGEPPLAGWTVQLIRTPGGGTPTVVATTTSDSNGAYSITGQEVGSDYSVRFISPGGIVFGGAVNGEQGPGSAQQNGGTTTTGELTGITLSSGGIANAVPQQSLPVDPSGVVYDSDTRLPVPGAVVRFEPVNPVACAAFDPAIHLVGAQNQTVGADGFYQFWLRPGAPVCEYRIAITPPGGYVSDSAVPPQPGPFVPPNRPGAPVEIVPNPSAPLAGQPTTWYQTFTLGPNSRDIVNNHVPLIANSRPVLFISKVAGKSTVELGESVKYTVKVRYVSGSVALPVLRVVDSMPAGFKLIPGTSFVSVPTGSAPVAVPAGNISGAPGAVVTYNIPLSGGVLNVGQEIELSYRVRVGVGSMQGDGINRAQAFSVGVIRSNIAQAKVKVNPGVFTSDACIVGKIYADCNNNHIQDAEEIGVPGVRLYMQDGTYLVSDSEGKYSICGLEPRSHVLKVDQLTLPRGARLTTTSNRNLGNADSLWLDLKNGEMQQADFAIGSCSNTVLEQVKARRAQGGVRSIENERKSGTSLKFEGKSANYPDQGTDGANQPIVQPRPPAAPPPQSDAENNTPVPQLPAASSNTPGNNIRLTK